MPTDNKPLTRILAMLLAIKFLSLARESIIHAHSCSTSGRSFENDENAYLFIMK